jgi:PST family polysaccharide transporter
MKAENKVLASNFAYLSLLQGVNYLLPLLTVPYLLKVLGTEPFGLLAFATALIAYFALLTDYGFNFTATRAISLNKEDAAFVARTYSEVLGLRLLFLLGSLAILLALVSWVPRFAEHPTLYLFTFGNVIGQALVPIWLFQGLERMQFITWINSLPKIMATIAIFIWVRTPDDWLLVPILNAIAFIISGLAALWVVRYRLNIRLLGFSKSGMWLQLKSGWHVFFSTIAVSLYTISTTFLLGLFTNNTIVGVFAAADKLARVVAGLYTPFAQAFYPYINQKVSQSAHAGVLLLKKMAAQVSLVMGLLSLALFAAAPYLSDYLFDAEIQTGTRLIRILSVLPMATSLSNIFAIQGLYSFGKQKKVAQILVIAGSLHLALLAMAIPLFAGAGAASVLIFTEIAVAIAVYFTYQQHISKPLKTVHP